MKKNKKREGVDEYLINRTITLIAFLLFFVSMGLIEPKSEIKDYLMGLSVLAVVCYFIFTFFLDRFIEKKELLINSAFFRFYDKYDSVFFVAYLVVIVLITLLVLAIMGEI